MAGFGVWLLLRPRLNALIAEQEKLTQLVNQHVATINDNNIKLGVLEAQREAQEQAFEVARQKLSENFAALSAEALDKNSKRFLDLAKENLEKLNEQSQSDLKLRQQAIDKLVEPIYKGIDELNKQTHELDIKREKAYVSVTEEMRKLSESHIRFEKETKNLVSALRHSGQRGRWGEIQLRRVVEMAGMIEYADFAQQVSHDTESGKVRPDLVVRMPNSKQIAVDAKVPFEAFDKGLEESDDATRSRLMAEYAQHVRKHVLSLSRKEYWNALDAGTEFVVMFIPSESMYSAALEHDPGLIEFAVSNNVVIGTPMTLIALLKAVGYGWRQEQLAENAKRISEVGGQLYDSMRLIAERMQSIGKGLTTATGAYNAALSTLEKNAFGRARKLRALGAAQGKQIPELAAVEEHPRPLAKQDLMQPFAALPEPDGLFDETVLDAEVEPEDVLESADH